MKHRAAVLPVAVAALILAFAVSAAAQGSSKGEVFATYSFEWAGFAGDSATAFPAGFAAGLGVRAGGNVWVVAEFGINSKGIQPALLPARIGFRHFMGGVRYTIPGEKIVPFVQVLAGGVMAYESSDSGGASATGLGIQPGAGVDIRVTPRIAVRAQADYQFSRVEGYSNNHLRLGAGVVFGF